jgi:RNA polymerase sigma-70 factor, ECF subfamily
MGMIVAIANEQHGSNLCLLHAKEREMKSVLSRYSVALYRQAFRYLRNAADAEDAVQDALLSACKHLETFRGQAQMSSWLTRIVINAACTQLRKRSRQVLVSLDDRTPQERYPSSERLPSPWPNAEEAYCRVEVSRHLTQLIRQLSPSLRRAFQLRYQDGLSIREIATVLGVTEGAVKARISRARAKLRDPMRTKVG